MVYQSINFTAASPILGPKDAAMVTALTASFQVITANIQQSVDVADAYTPPPVTAESSNKSFFRVAADWTLDSDADGIYDWQELMFNGSNPFSQDTDGDGQSDTIQDNSGPEPTLEAITRNNQNSDMQLPPRAIIERNRITAFRTVLHKPNDPTYTQVPQLSFQAYTQVGSLVNKSSYSEFSNGVQSLSLIEGEWTDWLVKYGSSYSKSEPITGSSDSKLNGAYHETYNVDRSAFRIRLEEGAPQGGYTIKLRLVSYRRSLNPYNFSREGPIRDITYEDIELKVAEGQTLGTAKMAASPNLSTNEEITTIPIVLTVSSYEIDSYQNELPTDSPEGICTIPSLGFRAELEGYWPFSDTNEITITWQSKRLRGNSTLGEWQDLSPEMAFSELANPPSNLNWRGYAYLTIPDPGVFQFQALLNFEDGSKIPITYQRMRHAKSIRNSRNESNTLLQAGQPDYIGVCSNQLALNIRNEAIKWLGSKKYAFTARVPILGGSVFNPSTEGKPKCNIFVTHLSNRLGATTPYYYRRFVIPSAPIAKEDWYSDPEKNIDLDGPGWLYSGASSEPCPGMVVASPRTSSGTGYGHVGFLDYDGSWINAGKLMVNKSLHLLDSSSDYKPNTFRRR